MHSGFCCCCCAGSACRRCCMCWRSELHRSKAAALQKETGQVSGSLRATCNWQRATLAEACMHVLWRTQINPAAGAGAFVPLPSRAVRCAVCSGHHFFAKTRLFETPRASSFTFHSHTDCTAINLFAAPRFTRRSSSGIQQPVRTAPTPQSATPPPPTTHSNMDPGPVSQPNVRWSLEQVPRRVPPVAASSTLPPPPLSWPTIPWDLLKIIIEQSPQGLLYQWCLVSKFCRDCATPVLYRNVDLQLREHSGSHVAAALLRFIQGTGRYCRSLSINVMELFNIEYDEPQDYEHPMEAMMNALLQLAIESMPRLEAFRWESPVLASSRVWRALAQKPFLTKLEVHSGGFTENDVNIGDGFSHLTSLKLLEVSNTPVLLPDASNMLTPKFQVASIFLILQLANILDNCANLSKLHLGVEQWDYSADDMDVDLFDVLFARPDGKLPGSNLKKFTVSGWSYEGGEIEMLNPLLKNLDCLTLYDIDESAVLEQLGELRELRIRKLRLRVTHWEPARGIIGNGNLELLQIELSHTGTNYEELIPLITASGEKLRELRVEWDSPLLACSTFKEILTHRQAEVLIKKCYRLRHLNLRADFEPGCWENLEHIFAVWCNDLISFSLQRAPQPRSPLLRRQSSSTSSSRSSSSITAITNNNRQPTPSSTERNRKTPAEYAGSFATMFVRTADYQHTPVVLHWVAFDSVVFEVYYCENSGSWVYSHLNYGASDEWRRFHKDKIRQRGRGDVEGSFFRVSKD
ncbi:hypothetical protein FN846DRAFT_963674 [Sphaerosporella brunnea]|uniref:Uncharacterized protein n=1 Tax=Sphaerosporella brunnea TaxID=1250544 RepID=A0A5J5EMG4_9PEZI|nr:hypothetical protein FN846DRAFT_963674 [Sphaerosporella brunnea]